MTISSKTTMNFGDKPKIVFFGSGPVAAASLELLMQSFSIEAVVTKPKPAHHKGNFPVVDIAERANLPLVYVSDKKEVSVRVGAAGFTSQVAVLIDFGIIVAQDVIDAFPLGIMNSHFSLLPELRGADPITFAILNGQARTGVSLMRLVAAMDEGPILAVGVQDLDDKVTTPLLTEKLVQLSYGLLKRELPRYLKGAELVEQSALPNIITDFAYPAAPTYTRKLTKTDGVLDFTKSAVQLEREVRAFADWPKSRTTIAGVDCIITSADTKMNPQSQTANRATGECFVQDKQLCIQTANGVFIVKSLKPAGKPDMSAQAFLAGYGQNL